MSDRCWAGGRGGVTVGVRLFEKARGAAARPAL